MRTALFISILFLFFSGAPADRELPVWKFSWTESGGDAGEVTELIFSAVLQKNWYLYSSDFDPELGPAVTEFDFVKNNSFELLDKIYPVKPFKKFDKTYQGDITFFRDHAEFRQKVKVLHPEVVRISGVIRGQVCNDKKGLCLPFTQPFEF